MIIDAVSEHLGDQASQRSRKAMTTEPHIAPSLITPHHTTPFCPRSAYAVARLCAYWITVN
jgi:GDP-D-mannose dehydratase